MITVGHYVQEAIDFINSGSHERAFVPTAMAIEATAKKAYQIASVSDSYFDRFFTENWQLIAFMGMPRALPLPMNIPYGLKRLVPSFDIHCGAKEIVSLAVTLTLRSGRMPAEFAFNSAGKFELKGGKLLLPSGSVCGLLGSVIFHTSNKDEAIGDHYWINISDFKMFVSELFGRRDLADRILRFYRE